MNGPHHRSRGRAFAPQPSVNPNGAVIHRHSAEPPKQTDSYHSHPQHHEKSLYKNSYDTSHQPRGASSLLWNNESKSHDTLTGKGTNQRPSRYKKPAPPPNHSEHYKKSHFYSPSRSKEPQPRHSRREVGLVSPQHDTLGADSFHDSSPHKKNITPNITALPPILQAGQSATHNRTRDGTQNTGNSIGTKSSIRQSKYFRMYESGNQTKAILGQDNLCWDVNKKQGAYTGNVFNPISPQRGSYIIHNIPHTNSTVEGESKYFTAAAEHRSSRFQSRPSPKNLAQQPYDMYSTTSRASYQVY